MSIAMADVLPLPVPAAPLPAVTVLLTRAMSSCEFFVPFKLMISCGPILLLLTAEVSEARVRPWSSCALDRFGSSTSAP